MVTPLRREKILPRERNLPDLACVLHSSADHLRLPVEVQFVPSAPPISIPIPHQPARSVCSEYWIDEFGSVTGSSLILLKEVSLRPSFPYRSEPDPVLPGRRWLNAEDRDSNFRCRHS